MRNISLILLIIFLAGAGSASADVTGNSTDLVIVSYNAQDTVVEGVIIQVSSTIKNQGDQITENTFYVNFYLFSDTDITTSDIYIGQVSIKVYDIIGQEIDTLVNEFKEPG